MVRLHFLVRVILGANLAFGKVQIANPESLRAAVGAEADGEIVASMANFGHINYGDSIVSFFHQILIHGNLLLTGVLFFA